VKEQCLMKIALKQEHLQNVSDMRGKLYLWISLFTMTQYRVFILYYEYPSLRVCSLCVFTKGMKGWAYENKTKGNKGK
jgi:hypothetical protein